MAVPVGDGVYRIIGGERHAPRRTYGTADHRQIILNLTTRCGLLLENVSKTLHSHHMTAWVANKRDTLDFYACVFHIHARLILATTHIQLYHTLAHVGNLLASLIPPTFEQIESIHECLQYTLPRPRFGYFAELRFPGNLDAGRGH